MRTCHFAQEMNLAMSCYPILTRRGGLCARIAARSVSPRGTRRVEGRIRKIQSCGIRDSQPSRNISLWGAFSSRCAAARSLRVAAATTCDGTI
jgi:hypothetical protein